MPTAHGERRLASARDLAWFAALLALLTASVASSGETLHAGLESGPHPVGFRPLFEIDPTRPYADRPGSTTSPYAGVGRPQRIFVWYPRGTDRCEPMTLGDYLAVTPERPEFARWNGMLNARARHLMRVAYGTGDVLFERLAGLESRACRDAEVAPGPLPWVVYSTGTNGSQLENVVLFEHLASYGFVVASVPQLARQWPGAALGGVNDAVSREAQVRDLEFAVASVRKLLPVDPERLGVMGFSGGGLYALALAGRYAGFVRAVVTLDGSGSYGHAPDLTSDPLSFTAPTPGLAILNAHKASERLALERFDRLPETTRVHALFEDAYHLDFTSLPWLHRLGPDDQDYYTAEELPVAVEIHRRLVDLTRRFLAATLSGQGSLAQLCAPSDDGGAFVTRCQSAAVVTTADDLILAALELGTDELVSRWRDRADELRSSVELDDVLRRVGRDLGYFYLVDEALTVLEVAAWLWPSEASVPIEAARALAKRGSVCEASRQLDRADALLRSANRQADLAELEEQRTLLGSDPCG